MLFSLMAPHTSVSTSFLSFVRLPSEPPCSPEPFAPLRPRGHRGATEQSETRGPGRCTSCSLHILRSRSAARPTPNHEGPTTRLCATPPLLFPPSRRPCPALALNPAGRPRAATRHRPAPGVLTPVFHFCYTLLFVTRSLIVVTRTKSLNRALPGTPHPATPTHREMDATRAQGTATALWATAPAAST